MNKTIEEAAKEYAETYRIPSCPITLREQVNQNHLCNAFIDGANHFLSLPLAERLTEEEREKIKNIYHECELIEMDDSPNLPAYKIEQAGTKMTLLESIFGEDFFKEET